MLNNDILRSLRYTLKANNTELQRIFTLGGAEASEQQQLNARQRLLPGQSHLI